MSEVAKLRKYKGLTQTDVADIFGISLQAYWNKENGRTPFTDKEKVVLKDLFSQDFPEITIDDIFFSDEVPKVEKK